MLELIVERAPVQHRKAMAQIDHLLNELAVKFGLFADLDAEKVWTLGERKRTAREMGQVARQLQRSIVGLRGSDAADPALPAAPDICAFDDQSPDLLLSRLRWHLRRGEVLLAVAEATTKRHFGNELYAAVTDQRLLIMKSSDLRKEGLIDTSVETEDIRFVRAVSDPDESPRLDVITKDENLVLRFKEWAQDESAAPEVRRFADLVASRMNLPAEEVPPPPISLALIEEGRPSREPA